MQDSMGALYLANTFIQSDLQVLDISFHFEQVSFQMIFKGGDSLS